MLDLFAGVLPFRLSRFRVRNIAIFVVLIISLTATSVLYGQEPDRADRSFEDAFAEKAKPLLERYCGDCHSGEAAEAEWDLQQYSNLSNLRSDLPRWVRVAELIRSRQMPPVDATQPSEQERSALERWLDRFLMSEAAKYAGDPGPVPLRRLSNAEYTYAIRDLTGVANLNPAAEFPEDAAVGEGFTNTGSGQGMSPAVVQKYLDAAKEVANHMVLLPDGIRFSASPSPNDQTNRLLADIQSFYDRYTLREGGTVVDLQSVVFETNSGGRLPIAAYLKQIRDQGASVLGVDDLPSELSAKYLGELHRQLNSDDPLLRSLGQRLAQADDVQLSQLVEEIHQAQEALWQFHPVGQLGREGAATAWMEMKLPVVTQQTITRELPTTINSDSLEIKLASRPIGTSPSNGTGQPNGASQPNRESADVQWQKVQFAFADHGYGTLVVDASLIEELKANVDQLRRQFAEQFAGCVSAVRQIRKKQLEFPEASIESLIENQASQSHLNPLFVGRLVQLLGLAERVTAVQYAYNQRLLGVQGHTGINGWGADATPNMLVNSDRQPISFSTLTVPARGVTVHPSPTQECVVAWRSPNAGQFRPWLKATDQDGNCGNGFEWRIELLQGSKVEVLGSGQVDNGQSVDWNAERSIALRPGDVFRLLIGPRDRDYVCDTTGIQFGINQESDESPTKWNLADDLIQFGTNEGNVVADQLGNDEVWQLGFQDLTIAPKRNFSEVSILGKWRQNLIDNVNDDSKDAEVVAWLRSTELENVSDENRQLHNWLNHVRGPMDWLKAAADSVTSSETVPHAKVDQAGKTQFTIPAQWLSGPGVGSVPANTPTPAVTVSAEATLENAEAAAQVWIAVGTEGSDVSQAIDWTQPFLISSSEGAASKLRESFRKYAELFPAALCYRKIVPVDEVVTLTLFHREDQHLKRLVLDEEEIAELDRLWEELYFVSQEPLQLVVALEQLIEFATQDRQDLVNPLESLRPGVKERADQFIEAQRAAETSHVRDTIQLAESAWRRPLSSAERSELESLYHSLRASELGHSEALQLVLARILTSAEFLFKLESEHNGNRAFRVSDFELASRLSFFLGSSAPDATLRLAAADGSWSFGGKLNQSRLKKHAHRLLQGPAATRMAIEFGCQWLHVRGFDQHNEKNEQLFPEFVSLRGDMNEEAIRFFERILREDRSILELLDSDWLVLNSTLANHYGLMEAFQASDQSQDESWKIIDSIPTTQRGGVLAMASVLASQSGASRTSPILRGNWVYETLLGQKLPNPPAGVPVLPEEVPAGLSARQLIEMHSSQPGCANCHVRIDPFGFALEQFDVLGRIRPVSDTSTTVEDGTEIEGLAGLKAYLLSQRKDDFVKQFCRKLLGFALGRPLQLSDELLLREMKTALESNEYRIQSAIDVIIVSPQFTQKRGKTMSSPLDS